MRFKHIFDKEQSGRAKLSLTCFEKRTRTTKSKTFSGSKVITTTSHHTFKASAEFIRKHNDNRWVAQLKFTRHAEENGRIPEAYSSDPISYETAVDSINLVNFIDFQPADLGALPLQWYGIHASTDGVEYGISYLTETGGGEERTVGFCE